MRARVKVRVSHEGGVYPKFKDQHYFGDTEDVASTVRVTIHFLISDWMGKGREERVSEGRGLYLFVVVALGGSEDAEVHLHTEARVGGFRRVPQ